MSPDILTLLENLKLSLTKRNFLKVKVETYPNLIIEEYRSATFYPAIVKLYNSPTPSLDSVVMTINNFSDQGHIVVTVADLQANPNYALETLKKSVGVISSILKPSPTLLKGIRLDPLPSHPR